MLSRRSFIFGAVAAASVVGRVSARQLGARGLPMLEDALLSLDAIVEGIGPAVHVIVAPGCSKAGDLWNASRAAALNVQFRWLPFGFGIDEDVAQVARAFDISTPQAVADLLAGSLVDGPVSAISLGLARRQDAIFDEKIGGLLWESTQMAPATPTIVFAVAGGGVRVVRGAIPADRFGEIVELTEGLPSRLF